MSLNNIQHIVLVLSGKGGVGKSSVTTQLALGLSLQGHSVGVLDVDLTGPSIPRFFGAEGARVRQAPGGWLPVPVHEAQTRETRGGNNNSGGEGADSSGATIGALSCMSLGFILPSRGSAVVWRGPKKTAMVRQFLSDVLNTLDYLLIDTPPGTSDEHISLLETLLKDVQPPSRLSGAVVVTTPQAIAVSDVRKELNFCAKTGLRVLGVVENMAGFVCPHCSECTNVFSKGGGQAMAAEFEVPFLGRVPIDPAFVRLIEEGVRPSYPEGTMVGGREAEMRVKGNVDGEPSDTADKNAPLVQKYTSCSLYPVFEGIVTTLKQNVEAVS
ncbi:cytosolic Fe-S cluster assembling factor cfd1 [Lineolata rhizophorae]|uniref:Cytosolic Fe-S cluster assembling factor cfd1 n=1 Tax=Lineolata rhizophorae TaxID=578093 RepID=A0A6A6NUK3_9PEZI|nr:cytosolic Fe-S cluster assembling factor cfd1 [Lineolata rhizophorae]